MVAMQAFYGLRASEVCALRGEDLTWTGKDAAAPLTAQLARLAALDPDSYARRQPRLRVCRKIGRGKRPEPLKNPGRGVRSLPLPQWLAAELAGQLARWPTVNEWIFTNARGTGGDARTRDPNPRPFRVPCYLRWFRQAVTAAGLSLPPGQLSHSLRHFAVGQLRAAGFDDDAAGKWIGDSGRTVSAVYGRTPSSALDSMAEHLTAVRQRAWRAAQCRSCAASQRCTSRSG